MTRLRRTPRVWAVLWAAIGAVGAGAHPSAVGPTGGLTTPSPLTLSPQVTEVSVHVEGLHEFSPNTLSVETVYDASPKVLVGIYDTIELGVEKTFRVRGGPRNESLTVNGKYRFPFDTFNVSLGVIAPTAAPDWTSIYVVMGWKAIWGGFGFNVGGRKFRELTLDQFVNVGTSKLGGYELRRTIRNGTDQFTGEPDVFYGLFGIDYKLAEHLEVLADYNGDRFTAGFRLPFHEFVLDTAYVTQRAKDTLFARETLHYQVAFTGHW